MKVNIKRIDKSLPLPEYQTQGSVAIDLYSRLDFEVLPKEIALIPSNVIIETPLGYMLMIASRSSTPRKLGLLVPHGIGIVDQDYCGPNDEVLIQVYNFTENPVRIQKGQRLAQAVFVKIDTVEWTEVETMEKPSRGGVGSTG